MVSSNFSTTVGKSIASKTKRYGTYSCRSISAKKLHYSSANKMSTSLRPMLFNYVLLFNTCFYGNNVEIVTLASGRRNTYLHCYNNNGSWIVDNHFVAHY
jgi:hypothetical protein